jgi:hypothetical protein
MLSALMEWSFGQGKLSREDTVLGGVEEGIREDLHGGNAGRLT